MIYQLINCHEKTGLVGHVRAARHPSAAITKERHFQSPADRSRITRNLMYYNRASLITQDCASEIFITLPLLAIKKEQ